MSSPPRLSRPRASANCQSAAASDVREAMGSGVAGVVEGRRVRAGSHDFVLNSPPASAWSRRTLRHASLHSALTVFVAVNGTPAGAILLADELRREAPRTIQSLRASGVSRIIMVTGDRAETAEAMGAALDLDAVLSERDPADKVAAVAVEQGLQPTLMVGDEIDDAPALAAAHVGVAMGARGASASSEAADVVILVDRLDRVSDALGIARRTNGIAFQRMATGRAMSGVAMIAAALGWLAPVEGALTQEAIDVAVILNALRALGSGRRRRRTSMAARDTEALRDEHRSVEKSLDRLRDIANALEDASASDGAAMIREANAIVADAIVTHEKADETLIYPRLRRSLSSGYGLAAMSRVHRELLHLAHLLSRLSEGLSEGDADSLLLRDGQRIISPSRPSRGFTTHRRRTSTNTPPRDSRRGTSSRPNGGSSQTEKLTPQPQEATAFGFLTRNDWPIRSSTKSSSAPLSISSETGSTQHRRPVAGDDHVVLGAAPARRRRNIESPSSRRP